MADIGICRALANASWNMLDKASVEVMAEFTLHFKLPTTIAL
jgi:hypothetical protein